MLINRIIKIKPRKHLMIPLLKDLFFRHISMSHVIRSKIIHFTSCLENQATFCLLYLHDEYSGFKMPDLTAEFLLDLSR